MKTVLRLAAVATLALLGACDHPRYYATAEYSLATEGRFASQGHFAVYYPNEIALDFPGYVVGIELVERMTHVRPGDLNVDQIVHAGGTMTRLADKLREGVPPAEANARGPWSAGEIPVISQVLRYGGRSPGNENCALYSLYQSSDPALMNFCGGHRRPRIGNWASYQSAFADSWEAVDVLGAAMREDLESGRYSHLVVAMMGWRTAQEEAIRNFNSLVRAIRMAGNESFRPLFVGITWAAPWGGRWLDPVMESISYPETAELADIIGLTWVGVLTERVVMPLGQELPTFFITHSFGSRAALTAVCVGPVIRRDASVARMPVNGSVDRVIGFQAALSLQRFKKQWVPFYEDVNFPNGCDRAKSVVLTTSRHDAAARTIVWADLAGNYRYYRSFCRENSATLVSCTSVDESGAIEGSYDEARKILYLDATKLLRYRAPGTNGGAHSDIFRPPAGRLIWNLISTVPAPARQPASGR
jgi:hypothetical protein